MKNSPESNYRKSFLIAVTFHLILLLLFLFRFNFNNTSHANSPSAEIVQATLITTMPATKVATTAAQQPEEVQKSVELPQTEPAKSLPPDELVQEKSETQEAANQAQLLKKAEQEKAERTRENALKKAAIEKQKQKQQKLQAEIQQQLEKEQQQPHKTQAKKQQKEIERLLQQDLINAQATKTPVKQASMATRASNAEGGVDNKEIDRYKSLIVSAISHQWIVPENLAKGLECRLKIRVAPGGVVVDVTLLKSSGDVALDRSAKSAVYKASPLPVPKNTVLFNEFREFNLTVRPEGILAD